jgi:hypothetical protein
MIHPSVCWILPFVLLPLSANAEAVKGQTQPPHSRAFLERYCMECHDSDTHKGGLNLEKLPFDLSGKTTQNAWENIFERLHNGSMPPLKAEQPGEKERQQILAELHTPLREASLQRQNKQGRVVLRRLSRSQYEDTLRDLLDLPALEVKQLLPEESPVAGFDNVSAAQTISSTHLVRFQQAADAALSAAIPSSAFTPISLDVSGREFFEAPQRRKSFESHKCWVRGDAMMIPSNLNRPFYFVAPPTAPADGIYRISLTGYGINTEGKSLPVSFNYLEHPALQYGRDIAWRDLPADTPKTVTVDLTLFKGQRIDFVGWTLPQFLELNSKLKDTPLEQWGGPTLVIDHLKMEGPLEGDNAAMEAWPPRSYRHLFGNSPLKTKLEVLAETHPKQRVLPREKRTAEMWRNDPLLPQSSAPKEDAAHLIRAFLPRAFRRPVSTDQVQHYVQIATRLMDSGITFDEAMRETYKSVLCSPHFLFFDEKPGTLDAYALASRLSYFFWNSSPDDVLLESARTSALLKPQVLREQVERMLEHPKAERFTAQFAGQWLELDKIDATTPDMALYREFDRILMVSSVKETELFFEEILKNDLSVSNFVDSDWTFLNRRLAQHYGIQSENPLGFELEKAALPKNSHRGGVITHASILKITADGARTSPILRGKWMCERILGFNPPPPPPGVPGIEPDIRGAVSIRQQLEKHRSTEACNSCHRVIDPPGFALESYDVIGGWREFYRVNFATGKSEVLPNYPNRRVNRGTNVEIGDTMPDGRPFADIEEYKKLLLTNPEAIARNLTTRLLTFATGADVQFADREIIDQIVARAAAKNYGLRSLIHEVVQSRPFLNK